MIQKKNNSLPLIVIALLLALIAGTLIVTEVRSTTARSCEANAIKINAEAGNVGTTKVYDTRPTGLFGCEYFVSEFEKAPEWHDDKWFKMMISIYAPQNPK